MLDHKERSPTALAHGAAKSTDIERVRRDVDTAELQVENDDKLAAARRQQRLRGREAAHKRDAQR
jgi:hypothetical protein